MVVINELMNLENELIKKVVNNYSNPFEILSNIEKEIIKIGNTLDTNEYHLINENIWVHKTSIIGNNVEIIGPAIIMENTILRHNAYIRENVIIGKRCIIGNSCEIKNSIVMDNSQIPHFNYVGDSILGNHVHLGAGVVIANLRFDKENIIVNGFNTNLKKMGAFIGDNTEIGCNSVVYPGTILEKNSVIFPLSKVNNKSNIKVERI